MALVKDSVSIRHANVQQVVARIEEIKNSASDFIADTRQMRFDISPAGEAVLSAHGPQEKEHFTKGTTLFTKTGLTSLLEKLDPSVPFSWFEKLVSANPGAATRLVNDLFQQPSRRLFFRLCDGRCRAVLSPRYMVMDNFDVLLHGLKIAKDKGAEILDASISDDNLHIRFTTRTAFTSAPMSRDRTSHTFGGSARWGGDRNVAGFQPAGNDTVTPYVTISNSETGKGGFKVSRGILRRVCVNGMVVDDIMDKTHLGGDMGEVYRPETRAASSKALMLQVGDVVASAFDAVQFQSWVDSMRTTDKPIHAPSSAVSNLVQSDLLSEDEQNEVLAHFIRDYAQTTAGLAQAISRVAQDAPTIDRGVSLERLAGGIVMGKVKIDEQIRKVAKSGKRATAGV